MNKLNDLFYKNNNN